MRVVPRRIAFFVYESSSQFFGIRGGDFLFSVFPQKNKQNLINNRKIFIKMELKNLERAA